MIDPRFFLTPPTTTGYTGPRLPVVPRPGPGTFKRPGILPFGRPVVKKPITLKIPGMGVPLVTRKKIFSKIPVGRTGKPLTPHQLLTRSYAPRRRPEDIMARTTPQEVINEILQATPEQPIQIPIQFGQVEVKAEKQTQQLLIGLGLLGAVGLVIMATK